MTERLKFVVLVVVAAFAIYMPALANSLSIRNAQVHACEGGNVGIRTTLHSLLTDAKHSRQSSVAVETGKQKAIDQTAADNYQQLLNGMVAAVAHPIKPGSYLVNCDETYPKPFPANIFS